MGQLSTTVVVENRSSKDLFINEERIVAGSQLTTWIWYNYLGGQRDRLEAEDDDEYIELHTELREYSGTSFTQSLKFEAVHINGGIYIAVSDHTCLMREVRVMEHLD